MFYQLMQAERWFKVHPAFTAWRALYTNDDPGVVADAVMNEIKHLAGKARIPKLYAVAQCGNSEPFDFEHQAPPKLLLGRS